MSRSENYAKNKIKKNKVRRWILFGVIAFLAVVTAGGWMIWARISQAERAIHQEVDTVNLREKEVTDQDSFSVLLLGIDNGAYGRDTDVGRSDTMLLATVNPKKGKTTIISIPRDSYTEIIGNGTFDKINHAYAFGKETMSINSVQNMLNVPIDYYVTVDMGGLMGLVDAVGGLEITPTLTFTYENESFTEGEKRHVDGEAALRYARMRYDDPEGDMGRQKRQQYVIKLLVEKLLTISSVTRMEEILKTLENSVRTNLTIDKLLTIQQNDTKALQNFESDSIAGEGAMINGIYYYMIPEKEKLRVSNVIRESLDLEKITTLKHIETNEEQVIPDVQTQQPANQQFYQEEVQDDFVEPDFVNPTIEEKEEPVTPVTPTDGGRGSDRPTTQEGTDNTRTTVSPTVPTGTTSSATRNDYTTSLPTTTSQVTTTTN